MPVIKLLRVFVLECLFLSIFISMFLGPLVKAVNSPCIKVQRLDNVKPLCTISTSSIFPCWKQLLYKKKKKKEYCLLSQQNVMVDGFFYRIFLLEDVWFGYVYKTDE